MSVQRGSSVFFVAFAASQQALGDNAEPVVVFHVPDHLLTVDVVGRVCQALMSQKCFQCR